MDKSRESQGAGDENEAEVWSNAREQSTGRSVLGIMPPSELKLLCIQHELPGSVLLCLLRYFGRKGPSSAMM